MKKRKFKIYLTPAENSIVIQSLNHLRNTMLRENRDTGCLDVFVKRKCEQKGPKKVSTFSTRFHVVSNAFPKYQMLTF